MAFGKRVKSILPPDAGVLLAEYGKYKFGTGPMPSIEATNMLGQIQFGGVEVTGELRDVALAAGGWATYGASCLVLVEYESDSEAIQDLLDARIHFLRSLNLSDIRQRLSPVDLARWRRLFPGEL